MPTRSDNATPLHAVILAGGGGTRLWPLSRRARPKQFLDAFGTRPLLVDTFARLSPSIPADRTWVVAGRGHADEIRRLLPDLPPDRLLVEPMAKNTAPAIGFACATIAASDPDAVVAVLPSDHVVARPEAFRRLIEAAASLAAERRMLVTLGIVPDHPATGYGYLERGEAIGPFGGETAYRVARVVEKPDRARAERFLASGRYLWNSGVFVWRAGDLLDELDRHLPDLGAGLRELSAAPAIARTEVAERLFAAASSISIDYAVMERSDRVALFPADVGWDDIGSFRSLARRPAGEEAGVRERVAVDAERNLVHAPGKVVALVGVDDLIVVDSGDALLVVCRDRAEDVKKVVEELTRRGRTDLL